MSKLIAFPRNKGQGPAPFPASANRKIKSHLLITTIDLNSELAHLSSPNRLGTEPTGNRPQSEKKKGENKSTQLKLNNN